MAAQISTSLRRSWIVIVGFAAPQPEKDEAAALSTYLRRQLNIVPLKGVLSDFTAMQLLMKQCNVVVLGGCFANEWAFYLNEYVEPKLDLTVSRERDADESWPDYIASGAITVNGVLVNGVSQPIGSHRGIIAKGVLPSNRLRPLEIVIIHGWEFEDTCTMVKAFMEDAEPGLYECIWSGSPQQYDSPTLACPADATYNKLA
jgi:hypothetical protein